MASEPGPPPEQPGSLQQPLAEGPIPLIYINWFRTEGNPGDLAIDVGYQLANMPQPAARLVLTWEHAKMLGDAIGKACEAIEGQIGEIRDLSAHVRIGPSRFGPGAQVGQNKDE
jgi:hypothetical protein